MPGIPGRVDLNRLADGVTQRTITVRTARPVPEPHFPGPVPKPDWFWTWVRWQLGVGEFEGLAKSREVRPDEAPERIPAWAWASLEKLVSTRRAQHLDS